MSNDDVPQKRVRRAVRPLIDREENEDELRRDANGRKRVDVVDCLLESSSDEDSSDRRSKKSSNSMIWLTLEELSHIRCVLVKTSTNIDRSFQQNKTSWSVFQDKHCDRCGKELNASIFSSSFLFSSNCFICQQRICATCSISNFPLPSSKEMIPIRLEDLLRTSKVSFPIRISSNQVDVQLKTVCFDCAQIFIIYGVSTRLHRSRRAKIRNSKRENTEARVTRF